MWTDGLNDLRRKRSLNSKSDVKSKIPLSLKVRLRLSTSSSKSLDHMLPQDNTVRISVLEIGKMSTSVFHKQLCNFLFTEENFRKISAKACVKARDVI